MDKVATFKCLVNGMAKTYEQKNSNYGDSFGKLYEELGPTAGLVPLYNKLHRATSLIQGDANNFESLEDTFLDLACYAVMNLIELRNQKSKKSDVLEQADYSPLLFKEFGVVTMYKGKPLENMSLYELNLACNDETLSLADRDQIRVFMNNKAKE